MIRVAAVVWALGMVLGAAGLWLLIFMGDVIPGHGL